MEIYRGEVVTAVRGMPLHRVLDLALLICAAKRHFQEAYRYEKLYDPDNIVISRIGCRVMP